jgi:hypothetical protein
MLELPHKGFKETTIIMFLEIKSKNSGKIVLRKEIEITF